MNWWRNLIFFFCFSFPISFPFFLRSSFRRFPARPVPLSTGVHSQFIQTRQVAPTLWGWSLVSSQMARSLPPVLSARGASMPSPGIHGLPDWTSRGRRMPGLPHTTTVQSGSRYRGNLWPRQVQLIKCPWMFKKKCFHQVDLDRTTRLTGIITQGAKDFGVVMFVSMFKVGHSNDGETWNTVKDEDTGKDKVSRWQGFLENYLK